ncbi:NAD(P)H-hydrate dehydratase [Halanaerobacter jeridensis]|uniref:Bifunctional NAD(P)H-hydrate repair enzyme n=1 Tax=Halanaerobacter jeridensis TaxID=706427 RepID=A0A939BRU7_9FIRM|nr:NAD(P)H-hydrate dehydratase [Halanaerobacter jeridensis]MBM7557694.1 NAD(P)H-hydrate epimerase [Halanaerobacter jeridensis]
MIIIKLVSGAQMGQIDRYTIEELGIDGVVLMEQAGRRVTEEILAEYSALEKVVVLAGKGNNGGDGFIISRLLEQEGIAVQTFLVGNKDEITGDAWVNLEILERLDDQVTEVTTAADVENLPSDLKQADLIVDAMLGTGIKGKLRGLFPNIIDLVNEVNTEVTAVDIPSGVEADSGIVREMAVQAQQTVTFALPKLGLLLYPGAKFVGQLKVVDIGIPKQAIAQQEIETNLITADLATKLLPLRDDDSHKGNYGKLLLVAGSTGMTGAAVLTARASLKMGAGLVTVGIPSSVNPILETKLTEAMTYPLAETRDGSLDVGAIEQVEKLMSSRDVLAIGPGLTTTGEVTTVVNKLLTKIEEPVVVDADGLNVIDDLEILKEREAATILTPHPGEMSRLLEQPIKEIEVNRVAVAREFAVEYGVILVLKGSRTVIATPTGEVYINYSGNSALATGGSGDVLTGLITSLVGQDLAPVDASIIAVYLHGLAAEIGSEELTKYSLVPSDLIDYLPQAIKAIEN